MEQQPDRQAINVLLVDDTPANLVALKAILDGDRRHRLLEASSGVEALKMVLREPVSVVLLDVVMPGMNGFEVAADLKAIERTRLIPILFLTAVATDASYVYRAYDVGAVDYLVKPLDAEIVRRKVGVFVDLVLQREAIEQQAKALREAERREYELRLSELRVASDRRYRKLVEGIDHAVAWTANDALALTFVSRQAPAMLGFPPAQFAEPDFWAEHLHPDDRDLVLTLFRKALDEGTDLVCNHRLLAAGGRVLWFHTGIAGEVETAEAAAELHGFSVDVTDLKRAEEEAKSAKKARDDLLAVVSHDLRGPLTSIKMSAALVGRVLASSQDPALLQKFALASTIVHASERMERLIDRLLDLARIEGAGGLRLELAPVDASTLVDETLELFMPVATEKNIRFQGHAAGGLSVRADRERVLQVLSNLVTNALKFTPRDGTVELRVARSGAEARFSIVDTGLGISDEDLPQIWNSYWQARREGGVGLGLAIARGLVEAHGGRIWAESRLGAGSTFHFTLPLELVGSLDRPSLGRQGVAQCPTERSEPPA
jgi:PAS domain S-box-containing protein